ncbi:MAG TPA: efflux RND transporter periplasmic adaptor subunit, partial [Planctomycetota bacterium]|nr:efflux RND transporter periplasmic adaptor subunit [Planctomycetota bacterium]
MWKNLRGWVVLAAILGGGYLLLHFVLFRSSPVAVRVHRVARGIVERTVNNTRAGSVRARLAAEIVPDA